MDTEPPVDADDDRERRLRELTDDGEIIERDEYSRRSRRAFLSFGALGIGGALAFVFGSDRIYYEAKSRFSGSPFARGGWGASYRVAMPRMTSRTVGIPASASA